jgi:hypothetical protein
LRRSRFFAVIVAFAMFAAFMAIAQSGLAKPKQGSRAQPGASVKLQRTVNLRQLATQARSASPNSPAATAPGMRAPRELERPLTGGARAAQAPSAVTNSTVVRGRGGAQSFDGLDAADQRLADNGNQFTLEPSDGALCQGGGVAVEYVNSVLQFFDGTGAQLTPPISATSFYGLPVPFDRQRGTFGPWLPGDINCVYDQGTGRFFLEAWATGQDFFTGDFNGRNVQFFGVQATSDPLGDYFIYSLESSAPGSPGCDPACVADHPLTATDANVYEINYNEFNVGTGAFNGARMFVLSKSDLESGAPSPIREIHPGNLGGGTLYSLRGGNVPNGGDYSALQGGTLFFLSALEYTGNGDTRIAVEALVNTSQIDSHPGQIAFRKKVVPGVQFYVSPPKTPQKPGPHPLGASVGEPLNFLDSGGDETQPTKFAGGKLWTVIDTQVGSGADARGGLLYIAVTPGFDAGGHLTGSVATQGYVAIDGNWLLYGDIAVKGDGSDPIIIASVAGPDFFPSGGYGRITSTGVPKIFLYGKGARPDDGFTCYKAFVPEASDRGCRFGDYNEANWGDDGNFYAETEYITSRFRVPFANWGTAVGIIPG